ncbi:MAG TPA: tetratricopeptide repeat protein [Vicinamibacterales bacterium]|jgi:tetratricopeptide (TPR) repeat protein|nr:tetratricopeptide repeat protein [Vicinamibacterales bacterium]
MFSGKLGRRTLTSGIAGAILALAIPAFAQTGRVQGKVVDDKDAAVPGAQILVTAIPDQGGQKWQATSDKNGNYIIGTLPKSGQYLVVAKKEGVGEDEARVSVKIGNFTTTNFKLSAAVRVSEEQAKKNQEIKKYFEAGVAAAQAGNHQAAVDAFTAAGTAMPTCADCFFNVGVSQQMMKNSAGAEAAFKKAIELRPNYPEAYNALAALYTADKKMDEAAAASAKAAELSVAAGGGGNADSLYSAGVGLWNANKFAEAGSTFEAAVKVNANHADSHFMLGKVNLNLGKLKEAAQEFEMYLKLEPNGKNAAEAKTTFEALKPMLK